MRLRLGRIKEFTPVGKTRTIKGFKLSGEAINSRLITVETLLDKRTIKGDHHMHRVTKDQRLHNSREVTVVPTSLCNVARISGISATGSFLIIKLGRHLRLDTRPVLVVTAHLPKGAHIRQGTIRELE